MRFDTYHKMIKERDLQVAFLSKDNLIKYLRGPHKLKPKIIKL